MTGDHMTGIDANAVIRAINQAEEYWYVLSGLARHKTNATGPKVATSTEPAAPLDLTLHDLAQAIYGVLRDLALDLADTTGEWPDQLDAPGAALFIRQHATTMATHPGMIENLDLLNDHKKKANGALGLLPRRTQIPEYCECGAPQWCYHEKPPFIKCKDGHIAPLADHALSLIHI